MADTAAAPRAVVLTGPTASGKSALAMLLAERIGGEIVSADSRQVYRGMDVGTAKPTTADRLRVRHHGLDLVDPDARYSAGRFAREARGWMADVRRRGAVPIVVGGTGFFVRALLQPLFAEPPMDPARRRRLEAALLGRDPDELVGWLKRLDPASAAKLKHGGGLQRVKRGLEVALLTGRPLTWWHEHAPPREPPVAADVFVLRMPRERLDERIDRRVDAMVADGLVAEVERLLQAGFGRGEPGMSAVGYREIAAHLLDGVSLADAVRQIQRATRQYARRQMTWFRNQLPDDAIALDATTPPAELVEGIVQARGASNPGRDIGEGKGR